MGVRDPADRHQKLRSSTARDAISQILLVGACLVLWNIRVEVLSGNPAIVM